MDSVHGVMDQDRVTVDKNVMGGRPCVRGLRVTVSTVVSLVASGKTTYEILDEYPYLEKEDIPAALEYAARCASQAAPRRLTVEILDEEAKGPRGPMNRQVATPTTDRGWV